MVLIRTFRPLILDLLMNSIRKLAGLTILGVNYRILTYRIENIHSISRRSESSYAESFQKNIYTQALPLTSSED